MNCLEFRRQLLTDPRLKSADIAEHRLACEPCARFAQQQHAMEQTLHETLHVEVPDGLASRILLRQRLEERRQAFWRRGLWAMAATLVVSMGLAIYFPGTTPPSLEASVLAHVERETDHMQAHDNVKLVEVNTRMKKYGAQLNQPVGTVNFAMSCPMRKTTGFHMVIQGEHGPVTVLVMPGDYIAQRKTVSDQRFQGVVMPTQSGSMAIVAANADDLAQVEKRLHSAMQFAS
jgi:anti-sigma factor RsiW